MEVDSCFYDEYIERTDGFTEAAERQHKRVVIVGHVPAEWIHTLEDIVYIEVIEECRNSLQKVFEEMAAVANEIIEGVKEYVNIVLNAFSSKPRLYYSNEVKRLYTQEYKAQTVYYRARSNC